MKGSYNNRIFEETTLTFYPGDGFQQGIIEGLTIAIKRFKKGERSLLTISPSYAFSSTGSTEYNIPPSATIQYEVHLIDFTLVSKYFDFNKLCYPQVH